MNPHNWIRALDPPFTPNRRWKCSYCGEEGLCDDLRGPDQKKECTFVYPPCSSCGQTPTCSPTCEGVRTVLRQAGVLGEGMIKIDLPDCKLCLLDLKAQDPANGITPRDYFYIGIYQGSMSRLLTDSPKELQDFLTSSLQELCEKHSVEGQATVDEWNRLLVQVGRNKLKIGKFD